VGKPCKSFVRKAQSPEEIHNRGCPIFIIHLGAKERSMTVGEMFEQSAILTALGMTVVFVFLWLMIIELFRNFSF
jgi:hypothetical protein